MKALLINTSGSDPAKRIPYDTFRYNVAEYMHSGGLKVLREYNYTDKQRIFETYYSYVVVRHPFSRLLSAFRDKFLNTYSNFLVNVASVKRVIRKHIPDAELAKDANGQPILTFLQFLTLIVRRPRQFVNEHWVPYMTLCNPCMYKFKLVIRLENLAVDSMPLLERLGHSDGTRPVISRNNVRRSETDGLQHVTQAFRSIPSDIIDSLVELYKFDFQMFGYSWDSEKGAGFVNNDGSDTTCH